MSSFLNDLWTSVFTPGTTPTLLIATNVSFCALQLLLATLLAATHSIHFVILSGLCGGLWWGINWFARELKIAQAKEEEAEKLRRKKKTDADWSSRGQVEDSADDEGEDTEVEDGVMKASGSGSALLESGESSRTPATTSSSTTSPGLANKGAGLLAGVQRSPGEADLRQRFVDDADRSGEVSTDSEWEKVSVHGNS